MKKKLVEILFEETLEKVSHEDIGDLEEVSMRVLHLSRPIFSSSCDYERGDLSGYFLKKSPMRT